jgi:hypothetical protein
MAGIEGALGPQFQSLSIVLVCAVNTKLASLWATKFLLQIYMELTGAVMPLSWKESINALLKVMSFSSFVPQWRWLRGLALNWTSRCSCGPEAENLQFYQVELHPLQYSFALGYKQGWSVHAPLLTQLLNTHFLFVHYQLYCSCNISRLLQYHCDYI